MYVVIVGYRSKLFLHGSGQAFDTMDEAKAFIIDSLKSFPGREFYIFKHVVTGKTPVVPSVFTEVTYDE